MWKCESVEGNIIESKRDASKLDEDWPRLNHKVRAIEKKEPYMYRNNEHQMRERRDVLRGYDDNYMRRRDNRDSQRGRGGSTRRF